LGSGRYCDHGYQYAFNIYGNENLSLSALQGEVLYLSTTIIPMMFAEYIKAAMDKATYEIIDDPEPFYGEIPGLQGVWATGKTLEACRDELMSALEDWIAFRLRTGRSIPSIDGVSIVVSTEPISIV
jgi:predicted RNase H-like HicB family nuclease